MLYTLLLLVHIVVCIFLIIVVLLQSGKAADLAGAFGGMGSQTAFGPRGSATLLSKATTISAVLFMVTSLSLSILATRTSGVSTTVLEGAPQKGLPVPAQPATAPKQGPINVIPQGAGQQQTPIPLTPAPTGQPDAPAPGQSTPKK